MAVIRVEKNKDFTVVSNVPLKDRTLTLKAKGLLMLCLGLPDDWEYSIEGLAKICVEGRDALMSTLRELEEHGYLVRKRNRLPNGKMGTAEYIIYENPILNNSAPVKPMSEIPTSGNTTQLRTNESNKQVINNVYNNWTRESYGIYNNVFFTPEEHEQLKKEFPADYKERIDKLSEYMEIKGKKYQNHLATIRLWEKRNRDSSKHYDPSMYEFNEEESL